MKKSVKITALLLLALFLAQAFPLSSAGAASIDRPCEQEEELEEGLVNELKDLRTADSQTLNW